MGILKKIKRRIVAKINSIANANKFVNTFYDEDKKDFVPISSDSFVRTEETCKLIAFYLPQFHSIPLNDENFGRGFTEWDNVTKAKPQFIGHYQPQLPIDVGFYDLSHDDVMYRQIELAKKYGIYGFCFHYYWFSGERLLEKPIFNFLNNKELDFPFCLCWANENWSKLWDGGDKQIIKEQKIDNKSFNMFYRDIGIFFKDTRYIKIHNKPLFIVYRPTLFEKEKFIEFIEGLRNEAIKDGFDGIFILTSNFKFENEDVCEWKLDGIVEFPPHGLFDNIIWKNKKYTNSKTTMVCGDMKNYIVTGNHLKNYDSNIYKGVFPSWDNTARKTYSGGCIFEGVTPDIYQKWLYDCIKLTNKKNKDYQFVFINAWNEWGEGAHLEPDKKYGYAYLDATKKALELSDKERELSL